MTSLNFWVSVAFTDSRQWVALARKAEALGFAGITLSDHVFTPREIRSTYPYSPNGKIFWPPENHWPDCWVAVGAMAAATTRLRFLTNVYILPLRNVFVVAKAVGTAAVLSDNRLHLGIGVGWMKEEFDQLGQDFHTRGRRTDEMIEVLRKLWAGGMVEHHGRFFDFPPLQMSPAPSQPVPILIGGESEAALRRAARLGDGWIGVGGYTYERIRERLDLLQRLRKEAGRDHLPFEIRLGLATPPTLDDYRRLAELGINNFGAGVWNVYAGAPRTLEEKEAALERFAENVIQKV